MSIMLCLFRRKIVSEKCFRHFLVFGGSKNNSKSENDFRLTKIA